jgi:pimeloyl-ACP methyl ester carboxylesterase
VGATGRHAGDRRRQRFGADQEVSLSLRARPAIHWLAPLFLLLLPIAGNASKDERIVDDVAYTVPSHLVDVEPGRRLNLNCTGTGTPVVVFESGLGDGRYSWGLVQPEISRHTRACSYDRAGLGFSDPANRPGTSANAVADLAALLRSANIAPPYVLVGHSYGGMNAKLFATTYPSSVAGLVLVDPSHEDQARGLFGLDPQSRAKNRQYLDDLRRCLAADGAPWVSDPELNALCVDRAGPRYSEEINSADRSRAVQASRVSAWISEVTNIWTASADQVRKANRPLGSIPLIVLTIEPSRPVQDETAELRERKNLLLSQLRDQAAAMSSRGRRVLVGNSGHYIQLDQPSAVIEAILDVLRR